MENALWDRIPAEDRVEVDQLIAAGRHVQAVILMRERAGTPRPGIHACVDLLDQRCTALHPRTGHSR